VADSQPKRSKHPDLIGLAPVQQLKGLPPLPAGKCGVRTRSCSIHAGGCGYRYKAGDKHWVCPECGSDRRCRGDRIADSKTCRMHGSGGKKNGKAPGHPPGLKYQAFSGLNEHYNEILRRPELLENKQEIAALEVRLETVSEEITQYTERCVWADVENAAEMINSAIQFGSDSRARAGLAMMLEAIAPYRAVREGWNEFKDTAMLKAKLIDYQRRWDLESGDMFSAVEVMELINIFQHLMFRFIPVPSERSAFMRILQGHFKSPNGNKSANQIKV